VLLQTIESCLSQVPDAAFSRADKQPHAYTDSGSLTPSLLSFSDRTGLVRVFGTPVGNQLCGNFLLYMIPLYEEV